MDKGIGMLKGGLVGIGLEQIALDGLGTVGLDFGDAFRRAGKRVDLVACPGQIRN